MLVFGNVLGHLMRPESVLVVATPSIAGFVAYPYETKLHSLSSTLSLLRLGLVYFPKAI